MPASRTDDALHRLLVTMAALRAPDGCPWDREQTPQSLTPYILEEAFELVDAIETGRNDQIRDELGDLLLQVVFQAQIFEEQGCFDFADIAETINAKLLRRHPHVFNGTSRAAQSAEELHRQWESIKRGEKEEDDRPRTVACLLPKKLPALQKAQKMVRKMLQAGLVRSLEQHAQSDAGMPGNQLMRSAETLIDEDLIGRQLLHWVMLAEDSGVDAESALRRQITLLGKTPLSNTDEPS